MHQPLVKYCDISTEQLVFDLKWVIESPGLLIEPPPQINWELLRDDYFNSCSVWLVDLEQNSKDLKSFFDQDHQFILGKYFEMLIQFIFENFEEFKLITKGLQVIKNNRTIGEIDFIFKNLKDNKTTHLEVAVKYYMGYKSSAKHTMWIGPNGMDNLAGKIQKFTTQLSMAMLAEELNELNTASFSRKVMLKGYFFKHINSEQMPHFCNPDALIGKWLYISELDNIIKPKSNFIIVPKRLWLGFYFDEDLEIFDSNLVVEIVNAEIQRVGKGILLAAIDESDNQIKTKYMVVPDRWPKLTLHRDKDQG